MFDRITDFFEEWPWLKFIVLRLALGMAFKLCSSVAKGLKLKVRKFYRLISMFGEVTGKKLVGCFFLSLTHPDSG